MIEVIDNLSKILMYYVPGYIFCLTYNFLYSNKINNDINIPINCSISFILISVIKLFPIENNNIINIISILSGFIIPYLIFATTKKGGILHGFLIKTCFKTLGNIWDDTINLKSGSNIIIYIKEKDYYICGDFKRHGNDWLVLENYQMINKDTNNICNTLNLDKKIESSIMVPFSEIFQIEVI